ncbi:MAG: DUF4340 domain-containing protein [Treponema sp.]
MKTRKIILLAACAVLLGVIGVQTALGLKNPVKTFALGDAPDKITIRGDGLDILLTLENGVWYVGDDKFAVNAADADRIVNAVKEVKTLDAVGKLGSAPLEERYGLTGAKAIKVSAFKDGKEIRALTVGKTSSTGAQAYLTLEGKKDIFLASSNLRASFGKSSDELKSKNVYALPKSDITAVTVTVKGSTWGIAKMTGDDKDEWTATGVEEGSAVDKEKANAWAGQISSLNVSSWLPKGTALPADAAADIEIKTADDTVTLRLFRTEGAADETYYCTSNKTPHAFELTKNAAEKFFKPFAELKLN